MRRYLLGSLLGHLAITLVGGLLSAMLIRPAPALETLTVDLATLELPAPEIPDLPVPAPTPEPEVETPPEPEPEPIPPPPVERRVLPPELEAESLPPEPDAEPVELVPDDDPSLPPPPQAQPEPEPEPALAEEEVDFLEPERVTPPPPAEETPPVTPPQTVAEGATVQASSTEGVPDYYLALVQRKIGWGWQPTASSARGRQNVRCVVAFRIDPQGAILGPKVVESSGLSVFDRQALRTVIQASPLATPPPRFARSGLSIRFTFVYNP